MKLKLCVILTILSLTTIAVNAGETQWVQFIIHNLSSRDIWITSPHLNFGKWHVRNQPELEIKDPTKVISPGRAGDISAAGRLLSPSGAEGNFYLHDGDPNDAKTAEVAFVYFDVPWGSKHNSLDVQTFDKSRYTVKYSGQRLYSPNLGRILIEIRDA